MNDINFLLKKIQSVPLGFDIDDLENWRLDIDKINRFNEIEPLFLSNDLSESDWYAFIHIINNKYMDTNNPTSFLSESFEKYSEKQKNVESFYLLDDKSIKLDFSKFNNLAKLTLENGSKCEEIILPENGNKLEMLTIRHFPKLIKISNFDKVENVKHLTITHCNKFDHFVSLKLLKKILFLNLSDNKNIKNINFFSEDSEIRVLLLIAIDALKYEDSVSNLQGLTNLEYLRIKATPKMISILREKLPNCCINGLPRLSI